MNKDIYLENIFSLENNELKKKLFIYTPFIRLYKDCIINYRTLFICDFLNRFFRQISKNVLFTICFNDLCYDYFILSKIKHNMFCDVEISKFNDYLDNLNIKKDIKRSCNISNNQVISFIQKSFINLCELDIIKFLDISLIKDDVLFFSSIKESNNNNNYFCLDIKKYLNNIISNIELLRLDNVYKDRLLNLIKKNKYYIVSYNIDSYSIDIEYNDLLDVYLTSAIFVPISHNYLITDSELSGLNYFNENDEEYFFTGRFVKNKVLNKDIPIFIKKNISNIEVLINNDKTNDIFEILGINKEELIKEDYIINSNEFNYIDLSEFRSHLEKNINYKIKYNYLTKIVISSNNKYGMPCPVCKSNNKLIYLDKYIPISICKNFRFDFSYTSDIDSDCGEIFSSFSSFFTNGFEPFINVLFNNLENNYLLNKDNMEDIIKWFKNSIFVFNLKTFEFEVFIFIVLSSILESEFNYKFLKYIDFLIISNNNMLNTKEILNKYGSDVLRLYYLENDFKKSTNLDYNSISKYVDIYKNINYKFDNIVFKAKDSDLSIMLYKLKEDLLDSMYLYNIDKYYKNILEFLNNFFTNSNCSKEQLFELILKLYSLVPAFCCSYLQKLFKKRIYLLDYGF